MGKDGRGDVTDCCCVKMYWASRAKDASLQMLHTHALAPLPPPDMVSANAMLSCPHRRAYHALSWGSDDGELRRGLELAKKVQQALINGEAGRRQAGWGGVGWGTPGHPDGQQLLITVFGLSHTSPLPLFPFFARRRWRGSAAAALPQLQAVPHL